MNASVSRRAVAWLVAGIVPVIGFAEDNVFTGAGLWSDTSLWSLAHIPTPAELAWVNGAATLESSQTTAGMNVQGALDITGAATAYSSSGQVLVGCFATNGTLTQTGGSFETTGDFYIGEYTTGSVTFTDTDVILAKCVIGRNSGGVGTYVQQGGSVHFQGSHAVIASGAATTKGTMSITDTALSSVPAFVVGYADGAFYATNSTITCTNLFSVANLLNSKGYAELVGSAILDSTGVSLGEGTNSVASLHAYQSSLTSDYVRVGSSAQSTAMLTLDHSRTKTANFYIGYNAGATGTVTLTDGSITTTTDMYAGYDGVGSISNIASTIRTPLLGVAYNSSTAKGYLYCGPGSTTEVTSAAFQIGRYGPGTVDCHGFVDVQSSTLGLYIGNIAGAEGTLNLYPGSQIKIKYILVAGYTAGTGTINQHGGDMLVSDQVTIGGVNISTAAKGCYNLYGGTFTALKTVYFGRLGSGDFLVSGGTAIFSESVNGLTLGTYAGSTGRVYLVTGTLGVGRIRRHLGYGEFFFDGGTLKALADRDIFCQGLDKAEIRAGGAKIDTDDKTITIAQSIAHDSRAGAPAKDGGLTKLGAGTLTMTGALGFTGDLGANGGTLNLAAATCALASGAGLWGDGTLVPPSGALAVPADSWVTPGGTNGVGTLTVNGNLTVNGELRPRISSDGAACGRLAVTGTLLFPPGSSLVIQNPEDMANGVSYTFASATSVSGTPTLSNLPGKWVFKTDSNQLRAVYLSGTLIRVR